MTCLIGFFVVYTTTQCKLASLSHRCTEWHSCPKSGPLPHRVYRVVTSAFWRTFYHEGKISPGWWGGGVYAHPLSLHLPSPVKLQCTLQLSGQIHWPCFISCKDMYSVSSANFHQLIGPFVLTTLDYALVSTYRTFSLTQIHVKK